jgi:hypothetical protein
MGDLMFQDIEVIARTSGYMDRLVKEATQYTHPKIFSTEWFKLSSAWSPTRLELHGTWTKKTKSPTEITGNSEL